MDKLHIDEAIKVVLTFVSKTISVLSTKHYRDYLASIKNFCSKNNITVFDETSYEIYIRYKSESCEKRIISNGYLIKLRKAAKLLLDCTLGKDLNWEVNSYKQKLLSERSEKLLLDYEENLKTSNFKHTYLLVLAAREFLNYLEASKIKDWGKFVSDDLLNFLNFKKQKYQKSFAVLCGRIKKFLMYLKECGYIASAFEWMLTDISSPRKKVLPGFTDEELNAIFTSVDSASAKGKRDLAIMKIAVSTGLRGIDILSLKLNNIDWRQNKISLVQSKNGKYISLELFPDAGNAIAEYILNARPKSDSPFIFLRTRHPYSHLKDCFNIGKKYVKKTGISHKAGEGKSFHAFRRTVGTKLVQANIPLYEVADILGHKGVDSVKNYASFNDVMLRECCMTISMFKTTKEGLV